MISTDGRKAAAYEQKAFTLIELLIVIAIIAILAAILFPVFAKVREKARQTVCLSNEKQMGLAIQQYVEDYDECYPEVYNAGPPNWTWVPGLNGVIVATYPYTKSYQIWTCPSQPTNSGYQWYDASAGATRTDHYIFNEFYLARTDQNLPYPPVNLSSISAPSNVIEIGELSPTSGNPVLDGYSETFQPGNLRLGFPHTLGSNYLYGDGHAKWVSQGFVQGQNSTAWEAFGFSSEWGGFSWQ